MQSPENADLRLPADRRGIALSPGRRGHGPGGAVPVAGVCRWLMAVALASILTSCGPNSLPTLDALPSGRASVAAATATQTRDITGVPLATGTPTPLPPASRTPPGLDEQSPLSTPPPATPPASATPSSTPKPAATQVAEAGMPVPVFTYHIVATYPHDPQAYTQGLVYAGGVLYESTGRHGATTLRRVDLESGEVLQIRLLPERYFGEGLALFQDRLYQLTWREQVGFVYDRATFRLLRTFSYATEGWGLCHDGQRLILSDGSATLRFLDPDTLQETGSVEVTIDGRPLAMLNELEYVGGEVLANVWQTDTVVRIDPRSGQVTGVIDLQGLLSAEDRRLPVDVLNGIAYDAEGDRLFVTGKLWPKLFEIDLIPVGVVPTSLP